MTTNPNLLFALKNITSTVSTSSPTTTTIATPQGPHRTLAPRPKDPRHGCINGIKIFACKRCAGHVLRSKMTCTACKGTGFSGARCNACAFGAMVAIRVLIKEVAADVRAGDEKKVKVDALAEEEASEAKEMAEMEEESQDGETEVFED